MLTEKHKPVAKILWARNACARLNVIPSLPISTKPPLGVHTHARQGTVDFLRPLSLIIPIIPEPFGREMDRNHTPSLDVPFIYKLHDSTDPILS